MRPGLRCCPTDDVEGVTAAIVDATDDAAAGVGWLRDPRRRPPHRPRRHRRRRPRGRRRRRLRPGPPPRPDGPVDRPADRRRAADRRRRPRAGRRGEPPFLAFHDGGDRTAPPHLSASACSRARSAGTPVRRRGVRRRVERRPGRHAATRHRAPVERLPRRGVLDPLGYVEWTGPTTPTGPSGPGSGSGSGRLGRRADAGPAPTATLPARCRHGDRRWRRPGARCPHRGRAGPTRSGRMALRSGGRRCLLARRPPPAGGCRPGRRPAGRRSGASRRWPWSSPGSS